MPFISRKSLSTLVLLAALIALLAAGFVWSGVYNVAADVPHTPPMLALMQSLRQHSIHARARDLALPPLDDPQLVLKGAGQYAAMCTGCHLAPGMQDSEIRPGLYPQPPNLATTRVDPRDAFWVIKHGVKMSAMPAWGLTHDDRTIWSMVAFLRKLPTLTPAQYQALVAQAPPDDDMAGAHHHDGGHGHDAAVARAAVPVPALPATDRGHAEAAAPAAALPAAHDHDDTNAHAHAPAAAKAASMPGYSPRAEPGAEAVARAFHAALQRGDRAQVLALLAPEVTVSEDGQTQDRAQYAALHLGEDIAFLKQAQVHPLFLGSMPMGGTAMVGSRSEIHAQHDGQPLTLRSTEILTLRHGADGWRITRIEWESERQASPGAHE